MKKLKLLFTLLIALPCMVGLAASWLQPHKYFFNFNRPTAAKEITQPNQAAAFTPAATARLAGLAAEEKLDSLLVENFGGWPGLENGDAATYTGYSGKAKATYSGSKVTIQGWGGGAGYPGASGGATFLSKSATENTPLVISNIDVSGYEELTLSFAMAWQIWWANPGIPSFRPTLEAKVDNGDWVTLTQTESQFPTADQQFKVILLPIISNGANLNGEKLSIRISASTSNSQYRLDDLVVLAKRKAGAKVTSITVQGANGATTITTPNGTLQLNAVVLPDSAVNKSIVWSLLDGSGKATLTATGLLKASVNGNVTARATARDGSNVFGDLKITISNQGELQAAFLEAAAPKIATIPSFINMIKPANAATVNITVNAKDTVAQVSKYIYGTNANQYSGNYANEPKLIKHIKQLNPGIIRYPGGLHSDGFFWDVEWDWNLKTPQGQSGGWFKNLPSDVPDSVYKSGSLGKEFWTPGKGYWTFGVDDFYRFIDSTGQEPIITVNYGYARYGTGPTPVQTAAHLAAEWVRYDNGRTKYWEVGNENLYGWSSSYEIDTKKNKDGQPKILTPQLYGEHFKVFADSMRKAAAEIGHTIYIGAQHDGEFFETGGDAADWFVVHDYFTPFQQNSNAATILNSAATVIKHHADEAVAKTQKYGTKIKPIGMTEWNIFAEGSGQMSSHVNGMHGVLVLGESIKHKFGTAQRWDISNSWGSKGDDFGMFSRGNTGQSWDKTPDVKWNPRAPFFHQYYFQKYFGDYMVSSTVTGSNDVVAYASKFTSGQSGVVVVNKGTSEQVVDLALQGFKYGQRYYVYTLTGGQDNGEFSLKVFVNGKGPDSTNIGGPIDSLESIKAFSAPIAGQIKFSSPGRSVQYILVESDPNELVYGWSYALYAKHSGKALGVRSNQTKDGIDVKQDTYVGEQNQQWKLEDAGNGYHKLLVIHSEKSLSIAKAATKDGAKAEQSTYIGGTHQKWKLEEVGGGYYKLIAAHSGKALTVSKGQTKEGVTVEQMPYTGADYQKWRFNRVNASNARLAPFEELGSTQREVILYPNPSANGSFHVQFNGLDANEVVSVTVTSSFGQTVYQQTATSQAVVHVQSTLKPGIYIVRVVTKQGVISKKLIVQ